MRKNCPHYEVFFLVGGVGGGARGLALGLISSAPFAVVGIGGFGSALFTGGLEASVEEVLVNDKEGLGLDFSAFLELATLSELMLSGVVGIGRNALPLGSCFSILKGLSISLALSCFSGFSDLSILKGLSSSVLGDNPVTGFNGLGSGLLGFGLASSVETEAGAEALGGGGAGLTGGACAGTGGVGFVRCSGNTVCVGVGEFTDGCAVEEAEVEPFVLNPDTSTVTACFSTLTGPPILGWWWCGNDNELSFRAAAFPAFSAE